MDMKRKSKKLAIILIVVGAIFSLAVGPIGIAFGIVEYFNTLNATKGELIPTVDDSISTFHIFLGDTEIFVDRATLANDGINLAEAFPIAFGNDTRINFPVQISFDNGQMFVSAKITNAQGATVATINNNVWRSFDSSWDRNFNNFAFEVTEDIGNNTDPEIIPALQIIMANQSTVFVGFYLAFPHGTIFASLGQGIQFRYNANPSQDEIGQMESSTIFKYPSSDYPNVLRNTSYTIQSPEQKIVIVFPTSSPLSAPYWTIIISAILTVGGGIAMGVGFDIKKAYEANRTSKSRIDQGNPHYKERRKGKRKNSARPRQAAASKTR